MDFLYHSAYKPVQPADEGAFQATPTSIRCVKCNKE